MPPSRLPPAKIARALLTGDPRLRPALALTLMSCVTYLLYCGIGALQVAVGTMPPHW